MPKKPGVCTIEGCGRPRFGHGYCAKHYNRWRRHGDPSAIRTPGVPRGWHGPPKVCGVPECSRPHAARGYCTLHARRQRLYGDPHGVAGPEAIKRRGHPGESHHSARLTWAQVREIRALHAAGGATPRALAAQYPVSAAQIGLIVAGKCWKEPQPARGQDG